MINIPKTKNEEYWKQKLTPKQYAIPYYSLTPLLQVIFYELKGIIDK